MPLAPCLTRAAAGLAALVLLPLSACAGPQRTDTTAPAAGSTAPASGSTTSAADTTAPASGAPTSAGTSPAVPASPPGRTTAPPLSRTVPPTVPALPKPPKPTGPTDLRASALVSGHITRGGRGPCYGLVSEDGIEYALHGVGYGTLTEGSFVSLRIVMRPSDAGCGPGLRASIVAR